MHQIPALRSRLHSAFRFATGLRALIGSKSYTRGIVSIISFSHFGGLSICPSLLYKKGQLISAILHRKPFIFNRLLKMPVKRANKKNSRLMGGQSIHAIP